MSLISRFPYMPAGSYHIDPEGNIRYRKELPEDIKKRFEADVAEKLKEQRERHAKGLWSSSLDIC